VALLLGGLALPDGMVVDHTCRNRKCVNPNHLRLVSNRTNLIENSEAIAAKNRAKTHCSHGHSLAGENVFLRADGGRGCRACRAEYHRRRRSDAPKGCGPNLGGHICEEEV
jgi:hypothetical protein